MKLWVITKITGRTWLLHPFWSIDELQKCTMCIRYGEQIRNLKELRVIPSSEWTWVSISTDYLSLPPTSCFGIFNSLQDVTATTTAYHLL